MPASKRLQSQEPHRTGGGGRGRGQRGQRGARVLASSASPHRDTNSTTTIPKKKKKRRSLIAVLRSGSEKFKGFLLKLEREQFHADRESLVVSLRAGNETLRKLVPEVGAKKEKAEQRQNLPAETPSKSKPRTTEVTVAGKAVNVPKIKNTDIDQLPTPESLDIRDNDQGAAAPAQETMAPMEKSDVDDELKSLIQTLYTIQSITSSSLPPPSTSSSQSSTLNSAFQQLASQLASLHALTLPLSHPSSTSTSAMQSVQIPESILDYIDAGRNPDIYTREFVELDQRGNAGLKGKMGAFADFSKVLAEEMKEGVEGVGGEVDRVLEMYGLAEPETSPDVTADAKGQENGEVEADMTASEGAGTGNLETSKPPAVDVKVER